MKIFDTGRLMILAILFLLALAFACDTDDNAPSTDSTGSPQASSGQATDDDDGIDDDDDESVDDDDDSGDDDADDYDSPCTDEGQTLEADPPGVLLSAAQRGNFIFFYSPGVLETIPESLEESLGVFSAAQVAGESADYNEQSAVILPEGTDLSALEGVSFAGIAPHLQVDENNGVHLVYVDHLRGTLKYAQNRSGAFQTEVITDQVNHRIDSFLFEIGPQGSPHVLLASLAGLKYYSRSQKGWEVENLCSKGLSGFDLAVDQQNTAHVLYAIVAEGKLTISSNESGVHIPTQVSLSGLPGLQNPYFVDPQIEIAGDQNRVLSFGFRPVDSNTGTIFIARETGGTWPVEEVLGDVSFWITALRMELNGASEPLLLWMDYATYFLIRKIDGEWNRETAMDCASWEWPTHQLLAGPNDVPFVIFPCLLTGAFGDAVGVWARYLENGAWKTTVAAPGGGAIDYHQLKVIRREGGGFAALSATRNEELIYIDDSSGQWACETIHALDSGGGSMGLDFDPSGFPIAAVGDWKTIRFFSKSTGLWAEEESWDREMIEALDLVTDPDGFPHVIYSAHSDDFLRQLVYDGAVWTEEEIIGQQFIFFLRAGYDGSARLHLFKSEVGGVDHVFQQSDIWQSESLTSGVYEGIAVGFLPDGELAVATAALEELCVFQGHTGSWSEQCRPGYIHGAGLAIGSDQRILVAASRNMETETIYDATQTPWTADKFSKFGGVATDMAMDETGRLCIGTVMRGAVVMYCADEGDLF